MAMVRKLSKILLYTLLGVFGLLLLLAGGTQTQFFRDKLRAEALSRLDSIFVAQVHLGEVTGNLVTGFSVNGLSIKIQNDTLIVVDRLDMRYSLFQVFSKTIAVENFTLVRPRVALLRGNDGVWNFGRMIRPTAEDTSAAGPFNWLVNAGELRVENGSIRLVDSLALGDPFHKKAGAESFEYHDFFLENLNLVISASLSSNEKRAAIKSLSFICNRPDFRLDEFSGTFAITPDSASVEKLVLQTGRSRVELSGVAKGIDPFEGISLETMQHVPVKLKLRAKNINLNELAGFVHQVDFVNGNAAVDLDISGEFGKLAVNTLDVQAGTSRLYVTGEVLNLHAPAELGLNVRFTESLLSTDDVRRLLPSLSIPDLRSLGIAKLNMEFKGRPLDFHTKFSLETDAGNIQSDLALKIGGPKRLVYNTRMHAEGLDLGKLLNDGALAGSLSGRVSMVGEGTSIHNMATIATVQLDSSMFLGQGIAPSELSVDIRDGHIKGLANVSLGRMHADLQGELDTKSEAFSLAGDVRSLNIEDILRDSRHNSDLTMAIKLEGRGLEWNRLSGEFNMDFTSSSRYHEYLLQNGMVHLFLNQQDPARKELSLESNIADFSLRGAFELDHLVDLISYEASNIRLALGEKFVAVDTALTSDVDREKLAAFGTRLRKEMKDIDATYILTLKNLEPLSEVAGDKTFDGNGTLRGAIIGNYESLSMDGRLKVKDFFYGNVESGILLRDAEASFVLTNLLPYDPLTAMEFRVAAGAARMHINHDKLDSVKLTFTYGQEYSSYKITSEYGDWNVGVSGIANVAGERVLFTLNGMDLTYKGFQWTADGGAMVGFSPQRVNVDNLILRRDTQTVAVSGYVGTTGELAATIHARSIDLADLDYVLTPEENEGNPRTFSGIADVEITASGTLSHPEYAAALFADKVTFRDVPFGRVRGRFDYKNRLMNTTVFVENPANSDTTEPVLSITGSVPMNLAIARPENDPELTGELDLFVRSDGVQMGVLDPLLPTFNQLKGVLTCNAKITGTMSSPYLTGALRIDSCSFLFVPNNIAYRFEGIFEPSGERIKVIDAVVRNVPQDNRIGRDGVVHISGDFSLRELKPTDFNLTAKGALLVVKETTRKSSLSVYGNLFVEVGDKGLHFTGTMENSLLQGYVLIRNSSLVFPPAQTTGTGEAERTVRVILWDDTSKTDHEEVRTAETRYFGGVFDTSRQVLASDPGIPHKSFLEGVRYDLEIESTGGNTEFRMIFNTATGEELVANLEGKFSILEDGRTWIGKMTIDRAYYNFTKRFNAEGTISYSGDYLNPEMNITARYQGTRVLVDTSGSDKREIVVVTLKITGDRKEPRLDISMTIDDVDYYSYSGPKSSDVNSDAIQYLITGNFPLTASQKNDIAAELRSTVGTSLVGGATSLLSSTLSEFLRTETGFINSIEIGYGADGGTFGESADIRLSGVAFSGLWRYGGKLLDDPLSNANISILYSFGDIFNRTALRNFMFELERKVETASGQTADRKEINSARLFYRLSF